MCLWALGLGPVWMQPDQVGFLIVSGGDKRLIAIENRPGQVQKYSRALQLFVGRGYTVEIENSLNYSKNAIAAGGVECSRVAFGC
jgi:hypothetical protein